MDGKEKSLQALKIKMQSDDSLPLKKGATRLVFGDGPAETKLVFIGEGPGYWEDQKGIPFVGNAGAFLNQLLALAKLERSDVFITNVVHHRPPENRDPEPQELTAYGKYLDQMLEIIDPDVIVTLGRFSMAKFLPGAMISSVHGKGSIVKWKDKSIIVIPMYHPAAGLRSTDVKQKTMNDFRDMPGNIEKLEEEIKPKPDVIKEKNSEQMTLV